MPTKKTTTPRKRVASKQPSAPLYKYTSRIPVRHDLDISLDDSTEKLNFFLIEAHAELGHTPNPLDREAVALADAANAVRDELYRRLNA